ncbi:YitT family protein [Qingshengfaniella alkalisoli]|uniref:YitT family protein n=1 Tax=Qingshengfaniella alkalisoli TaxID=2599296 RepID=A0A5B8J4M6_9RHOB|nr:YitT family protein [Qingshengfaniella alkalisoli]QDY69230.1 YitT family protein [Qingshengfaniella alkalisoli]
MAENATKHTPLEDAQGLGAGVFLCALGLVFLTHLGFITGQTAGIAVIISYLTGWSFGPIFFVINLPFYLLAWHRLGPEFTLKTVLCVTALSVLTSVIPQGFGITHLNPALGAIAFGVMTGVGLLALFRHKGSLGGIGVVGLLIQDTTGFRAGYFQLAVDLVIFCVAFLLFPAERVLYSLLGAVVLNLIIAINHRRDRYLGT